jgi:hypothetical protein
MRSDAALPPAESAKAWRGAGALARRRTRAGKKCRDSDWRRAPALSTCAGRTVWSMIPKSGYRFSEKIMFQQ